MEAEGGEVESKMPRTIVIALAALVFVGGFSAGEMQAHIKRTMWGYVWNLDPEPDFPKDIPGVEPLSQLVECPDGKFVLPPWHVKVLYYDHAPWRVQYDGFLQERGR